jgi:hypothetical protein
MISIEVGSSPPQLKVSGSRWLRSAQYDSNRKSLSNTLYSPSQLVDHFRQIVTRVEVPKAVAPHAVDQYVRSYTDSVVFLRVMP